MRVRYCPNGGHMELGLCYRRCPLGFTPLGCSCWQGARSQPRGCGTLPASCDARSFAPVQMPPVLSTEPFTFVLSADPQLFRVESAYNEPEVAAGLNRDLAESIQRAAELPPWPHNVSGGAVLPPRSLVVLGDLTESGEQTQHDAFRHFYDPSYPGSHRGRVTLPTWLMLGNHDMVNNQGNCWARSLDSNGCARLAVDLMRSAISPECHTTHWAGFPKSNVTTFDVDSMSYSFDVGQYHFVMLQYNPRYAAPELSVRPSMSWLAGELARATLEKRYIVLCIHAHKELGLARDTDFAAMLNRSSVVALFYGHIHIAPWGLTGTFPNTSVPIFNCGASWYRVYCLAEFGEGFLRVGAVRHRASDPRPRWSSASLHRLPPLGAGGGSSTAGQAVALLPASWDDSDFERTISEISAATTATRATPPHGGQSDGSDEPPLVHRSLANAAERPPYSEETWSVLLRQVLLPLLGAGLLWRL